MVVHTFMEYSRNSINANKQQPGPTWLLPNLSGKGQKSEYKQFLCIELVWSGYVEFVRKFLRTKIFSILSYIIPSFSFPGAFVPGHRKDFIVTANSIQPI